MDESAEHSAVGTAPTAEGSTSKAADIAVADNIMQALSTQWSPEEQKIEMDSWTDEKVSGNDQRSAVDVNYKTKRKHFRAFEVLILVLALLVIVIVVSFPTVLFSLPEDDEVCSR